MKTIITLTEHIFALFAPALRPEPVQQFFRHIGIRLPYRYAKHLNYFGVVNFKVDERTVLMQSINTPIEMTIFWKGIFGGREGAELRVWRELTKSHNFILDIGANTGIYSLVAGVNESAKIYAFEPVPVVNDMLKENIKLNNFSNIISKSEVVSDRDGKIDLYIPKEGWVDVASVEEDFAAKYADTESLNKLVCDSVTIDSFLNKFNLNHEFVIAKVDVEGAEKKVIHGMKQTLKDNKIIVLAELLNKPAFAEVVELLPDSYCVYGVVSQAPYTQKTEEYVKGIKNYLLLPRTAVNEIVVKK